MKPSTEASWEQVPDEGLLLHIVHTHRDGSKQELVVGEEDADRIAGVIARKPAP